jgi:sirohydrochlorin ferrochelatase
MVRSTVQALVLALSFASVAAAQASEPLDGAGILLLAHGGRPAWNERVLDLARQVDTERPVEVAFGMATRANIQAAIDRLIARGVKQIVAVPLFISSHSSVVTSTEYLLGLRAEAPKDLALFAKMNHGSHGGGHGATAHDDGAIPHVDPTSPIAAGVPVRMTAALNDHRVVGEILAARATAISRDASRESVIVVAHGPVPEDDNRRWLADMKVSADHVRAAADFRSVDSLTVRDDAPPAIRDAATAELRALVQQRIGEGNRVLVVPQLLSFGGIEQGIRKRLEGLDYVMAEQGLVPDDRLVGWVLEMAAGAPQSVKR